MQIVERGRLSSQELLGVDAYLHNGAGVASQSYHVRGTCLLYTSPQLVNFFGGLAVRLVFDSPLP